ncbi:hypothetical protein FHG87_025453 [Trinorchestia longiramus]|nr:hypothetical protein FHG87_025453 [Trinorchestia longiramus]
MLYGQSLRLPVDIVNPDVSTSFSLQNQNSYSDRLKRCMTQIRYVAPRPTQTVNKLDPALETCTHVYVRVDAVKPALTRPYEGPFLVIRRTAKYFIIEKHGKQDSVSIDRLKAAFVSDALIPNNLPPPDVTDLSVDDKSLLKPLVCRLEFASQLAASLPSSIPCNPFLIPSRSHHRTHHSFHHNFHLSSFIAAFSSALSSQLFHHNFHLSFFITASIIALISVLLSAFTALSAHCSHPALSAHCFDLIVALLNPIPGHIADHIADHIPDHISDYVLDHIFDHILDHYF